MTTLLSAVLSPVLSAPAASAAAALPLERGTWFDAPEIKDGLARATFETLAMVGISTVIASALGLILGMILVATGRGGLLPSPLLNKTLGFIVNVGRAIPFIIFVFILIGFSRAIAGTGSASPFRSRSQRPSTSRAWWNPISWASSAAKWKLSS